MHARERIGVGGHDRAQMGGAAVTEDDIGFPPCRIVFHASSIGGPRTRHRRRVRHNGVHCLTRSPRPRPPVGRILSAAHPGH
ncbi:hypothetical protein DN508_33985, partial [Burkholderia multivorans]